MLDIKQFLCSISLGHASSILQMYARHVFQTADEIRIADVTINCKIIFKNNTITSEDLEIYKHMQKVLDVLRNHHTYSRSPATICYQETSRCLSNDRTEFYYFTRYNETEGELSRLNIVERRIIFAFKRKNDNMTSIDWLKGALCELLNYVLRAFDGADRVGIVIKHEQNENRKATFPINFKKYLEASIILDTLNAIVMIKGAFISEERMTIQVVRIGLPVLYKQLTAKRTFRNQ